MKKLLLVLALAFSLSSCYEDVNKSVTNPAKETTSYLQHLPKDTTVTVAYERHSVYIFDAKTNLLKYKADSEIDSGFSIDIFLFLCICVMFFLLGALIGSN